MAAAGSGELPFTTIAPGLPSVEGRPVTLVHEGSGPLMGSERALFTACKLRPAGGVGL